MQKINSRIDLDSFFSRLHNSDQSILFLDYDGTLAPFEIDPKRARPYAGVLPLLQQLCSSSATRVIIVTGRALSEIISLLPLSPLPEVWGAHGGERLIAGNSYSRRELSSLQQSGLEVGWREAVKLISSERCEKKPFSLAVHWRGVSEELSRSLAKSLRLSWEGLQNSGLKICPFDGGLELKAEEIGKDIAIREVLGVLDHQADFPIAYLGDDLTDEDAFAALGERALKVLVRTVERPSLADIRITPPEELLRFLQQWVDSTKFPITK